MTTVALLNTPELSQSLEEAKKRVLPDKKTAFEVLPGVLVVLSGEKAEARLLSPFESGVKFAPFHFVRDCLKNKADAAFFVNGFLKDALPVPEPADTREGLEALEADAAQIPGAEKLTDAAKSAGFDGVFPDFEKTFVCKKALVSQGLALKSTKNKTLRAFVRFRGGESGVSALCGITRGDPALAPLENKEVVFFDSLYFAPGEGDPAEAFLYALLEDDAPLRFSRRIRPGREVPAHLFAALFWALLGTAVLLPFALPAAVKLIPAALALVCSAARLLAMKFSVRR
ncbi:MAG: hypothetical protein IJV00_03950 [Clostridia bacterium]|nr:hypothetical protein [Clostridia bacterium]